MKKIDKIKLARKMRTQSDIKAKVPIFQTENWDKRKITIQEKVKKREKLSRSNVKKTQK